MHVCLRGHTSLYVFYDSRLDVVNKTSEMERRRPAKPYKNKITAKEGYTRLKHYLP